MGWHYTFQCMMLREVSLLLAGLFALSCAAGPSPDTRQHPCLFITDQDGQRARAASKTNDSYNQLAKAVIDTAATNDIPALPVLETNWWIEARHRPWAQTYPEIFHHTWVQPWKWADFARTCARAALLSQSEKYADKGREALLKLSDYSFEFEHYDVGMNYTVWTTAALEAYDILYDQFSDVERGRIDSFFQRYREAVRKNDNYWVKHEPGGKLNNHYAWHKLGIAMTGLFYGQPEDVDYALKGPKGVYEMMNQGFRDDGLWLEGSIPYQFAETTPLVIMAQLLENAGYPESLFSYRNNQSIGLKDTYKALVRLLLPDRTLPTIGDCYARRPHVAEGPDWEVLYRRFREPACGWLIRDRGIRAPTALFWGRPELPQVVAPVQVSGHWPEMGYVALRSNEGTGYWSGAGWTVFATYSGQTVHEHADKLSIILYADGHLWLPDREARTSAEHAFSASTQGVLNRQTLGHNTLLVNGLSQTSVGHRLDFLGFTNTGSLKQVSIGDLNGRLYRGVRQLRTVAVTKDFVLDFFQAASDAPSEFAWLTHVDGERIGGSPAPREPVSLPKDAPWSYLRNPRAVVASGPAWEAFRVPAGGGQGTSGVSSVSRPFFRMDLQSDAPMDVIQCAFPKDDSASPELMPMRIFKRHGTSAWFAAVYRTGDQPPESCSLSVRRGATGWSIMVGRNGQCFEIPSLQED